ncbi:MAG: T9SS type A sorting domain-containing protein, partial [Bacteroidales bacterium]
NSITNVYPSPVTNTLHVDLTAVNSKVAVYNAIGQKLMEKTATGNKVTFDVSSLRRGMYFVKLEDGTTKKFVK